jgi:hypothetical protein
MYLTLVASVACAWVQLVYICRWRSASWNVIVACAAGAAAAGIVAWWFPWAILVVLFPVDLGWYVRTVADVLRSTAAATFLSTVVVHRRTQPQR